MRKKFVLKKAMVIGAALTLSVITGITINDAIASTLSTETELAGISVTLDNYYTATVDEATGSAVSEDAEETESAEETTESEVTEKPEETDVNDVAVGPEEDIANSVETAESKSSTKSSVEKSDDDSKKSEATSKSAAEKKDDSEKKDEFDGPGRFITEKRFENVGISIASEYVNVRKEPSETSKIKGKLYRGCAATILKYEGDWVKIESGDVKGYIKKEFLAIGEDAQEVAAESMRRVVQVKKGVVTLNVRSKKGTNSSIVTMIPEGETYEVKGSATYWVKIDLGDGDTGYVAKKYVDCKVRFKHAISIAEERARIRAKLAAQRAERKRLKALAAQQAAAAEAAQQQASTNTGSTSTYTAPSTNNNSNNNSNSGSGKSKSSSPVGQSSSGGSGSSKSAPVSDSSKGSAIAAYAQKFVGNPYVYGGTSLTNGTDCSGFVMSVYAQYGYSLPRTAAAQAGAGTSVSLSNLQPGDLLFYSNGSYIGHVAMYIGGGSVVHASNPTDGIKISAYNYRTPTCARRIV